MGVDIHTYVITKDGKIKATDLYEGRCTEWFNNLMGRGDAREYDYLPVKSGIPKNAPAEIKEDYELDYYGFNYITVKEWRKWFKTYKPNVDAGWVRKYDKWAWETKHINPSESCQYLDEDMNPNDWEWCEFRKDYDSSEYLTKKLAKMKKNDILIFYFDC